MSFPLLAVAAVSFFLGLVPKASAQETPPLASLSQARVEASGRREVILNVRDFGRYAVLVRSPNGSALQLVDRMAGPGPLHGRAGEADGRIDAFLDRGEYKIVVWSHELGTGEAALEVHPFLERNVDPLRLVESKPLSLELDDFESRSYWLPIAERRRVVLEAAGRNLSDLRLWKDGTWLLDASPTLETITPRVGQPLTLCRLTTWLEPGLYRLTGYGGPSQPWSEESAQHPFHLRYGIPRLGVAGRRAYEVSPFGFDRYLISGRASFYRIELAEARDATLKVSPFDAEQPFLESGARGEVTKESLPPATEIELTVDPHATRIVMVTSRAGQAYVLQHFEKSWLYGFEGSGNYWLSTIHSGHPADSIDATGIVVAHDSTVPLTHQAIPLGRTSGWAQRANLLDRMTLFIDVAEPGRYEILSRGTEARFRLEPFLASRPADYEPPPFQGNESVWDLDRGLYVLNVEPVSKGILDVAIKPVAFLDTLLNWVGLGTPEAKRTVRASVRFPSVSLSSRTRYSLVLNEQPGVKAGVVLRALPLDLREPLALTQRPEETVDVPFETPEEGLLTARTESGELLPISLDGSDWARQHSLKPGLHRATVRNDRKDTLVYSLELVPERLASSTPLPRFDEIAENAYLATLPVLTETEPRFFDLARNESASFLVRADAPALYQLQTTGLLATEGNLRTRTVISFRRQAANGVGRNFLIQQYLREGDYQVTVTPQGYSTGRVGLRLERTTLVEGGELQDGLTARATLAPGEAISYDVLIQEAGTYQLETLGLGRSFLARLEDEDGWPIEPPNRNASYTRRFDAGRYRLILLPDAVETRRVTRLDRIQETRKLEGHGPHPLDVESTLRHVWTEPAEGGPREPDVWQFSLPAAVEASIQLTSEMEGKLLRIAPDGSTEEAGFVPPGRGFRSELSEGRYRLEVVCSRENNAVEYEVSITPTELVAGAARWVQAPAVVPIAGGSQSLAELSSFFNADVRATLLDEEGKAIARNDDRPDDWNFQILERLPPGRYSLQVEPVGAAQAQTVVAFSSPREVEQAPLLLPVKMELQLGEDVELFPLRIPPGAAFEVLAVALSSPETVGAALEAATEGGYRAVASALGARIELALPLAETGLRLRLWSSDKRRSRTSVEAILLTPSRFSESEASRGIALAPVSHSLGAAAVALDASGVFRIDDASARWSSSPLRPFELPFNGLALATEDVLWILGKPGARVALERARVGAETVLALEPGRPVEIDLERASPGPVAVLARSFAGQPAARVSDSMSVGAGSALSASLGSDRASVWVSDAPGGKPVETRVQAVSFAEPSLEAGAFGTIEGRLEARAARAFDLPAGRKTVSLALDEATAAILSGGGEPESVHWQGGARFEETLATSATRLTLLHYGEGERAFVARVLPGASARSELSEEAPFEEEFGGAGSYRLDVPPGERGRLLRVSGAAEEATFVGASGRVLRGRELSIEDEAGYLLLHHRPGTVVSWIESEEPRVAEAPSSAPLELALPARPSLTGRAARFRLALPEPVVLHLRTTTPVATVVSGKLLFHPDGATVDALLPRGESVIEIRAVGDEALSGRAEMTTSAVAVIGEGLGPEVLLPAGSTRVFSFEVKRAGGVGVGVRATSDAVSTTLLDESGNELGRGVVQMHELSPGRYFLAIESARHAPAVTARPAVAGIAPPETGPPGEVIRRYIESGSPR